MRAARERAELTQEEVAERMNVSIHTFRPWDRGTRKPARLEQRKLLALILGTPVDVIWPSEQDPQVATALRREAQRTASRSAQGAVHHHAVAASEVGRAASAGLRETDARRCDSSLTGSSAASPEHVDRTSAVNGEPGGEPASSPGLASPPQDDEAVVREGADDLPPWPVDQVIDVPGDDRAAALVDDVRSERWSRTNDEEGPGLGLDSVPEGDGTAVTLTAKPRRSRRVTGAVLAVVVAIVLGGAGMIAAGAFNDGAADAESSARTSTDIQAAAERERVADRARQVAEMRAQTARGNFDAAIVAGRALGDPDAVERYRQAAASVLVRRANAAAGRGDLSLARKRLRIAAKKYGATAGALDVQRRIRRIERARADRAKRRRAAARQASSDSVPAPPAGSEGAQPPATVATKSPDAESSGPNGSSSSTATSGSAAGSSSSSSSSGSRTSKCEDGCGLGPFP